MIAASCTYIVLHTKGDRRNGSLRGGTDRERKKYSAQTFVAVFCYGWLIVRLLSIVSASVSGTWATIYAMLC